MKVKEDITMKQASLLFMLGAGADKAGGKLRIGTNDDHDYRNKYYTDRDPNRRDRWTEVSLDNNYVTLHDVSENFAFGLLNRLSHEHALDANKTTGGGICSYNGPFAFNNKEANYYDDGYRLDEGQRLFLDKNPSPTADIQFNRKEKTLKLNAEKINGLLELDMILNDWIPDDGPELVKRKEAFLTIVRVLAGEQDSLTLTKSFNAIRASDASELDPTDPQTFEAFAATLKTAATEIKDVLTSAGVNKYMSPTQINKIVTSCTGKKLKVM